MSLNIGTQQLPDAFVGVSYNAIVVAGGGTESGDFEYVWTVAPKGGTQLNEPAPGSNTTAFTGLPAGLTWSASGNVLTISGTPGSESFDDSVTVYPANQFLIEFRVQLTGDFPEASFREITFRINRIINESTSQTFLSTFQEPNGYLSQTRAFQAMASIESGFPEGSPERVRVINEFTKHLGIAFLKQEQTGEYNMYYDLNQEKPV